MEKMCVYLVNETKVLLLTKRDILDSLRGSSAVRLLEFLELCRHGVRYFKVTRWMFLLRPRLLGFHDEGSHLLTIRVGVLICEKLARPAQIIRDVRIHLLLEAQLH